MTPSRTASALILFCSVGASACRDEVSLGNPPWTPSPPRPSRNCETVPEPGIVAEIGAEYGPIRAMLGNPADGVYVVAAPETGPGTLLLVRDGSSQPMGTVGLAPAQMAMARDSVYVTSPDSAQVFRVYKDGSKIESILGQPNVRAITVGRSGEVYWALAGETGSVHRYGLTLDKVETLTAAKFPTSLAFDGTWLYISGQGSLMAFTSYDTRALSVHCDGPALALTERSLFCADGGAIHQISRNPSFPTTTRATFPEATVFEPLAGAGRLFFRLVPRVAVPGASRIMAMPIDDEAQPTVFAALPDNGQFLAMDRCNLYAAVGNSIMRWPL